MNMSANKYASPVKCKTYSGAQVLPFIVILMFTLMSIGNSNSIGINRKMIAHFKILYS